MKLKAIDDKHNIVYIEISKHFCFMVPKKDVINFIKDWVKLERE